MNQKKTFFRFSAWALVITVVAAVLLLFMQSSVWYRASVLMIPEHAPFNGTVSPIKKVPNWSNISADKFKARYTDLSDSDFMSIPQYKPAQLEIDATTLKWGNAADNVIRNAKITYPVVYVGTYKLDGKEYAGSHPAVDIKIPEGTPIYAIANGTVMTAANLTTGFGKNIVLIHKNVPSINDSSIKTTLYSSYSHLSQILVSEGDVVTKGQQIGLSGSTGTATTPHLHFQIDNDQSNWHPFWPFTSTEAYSAGLNFFSAIDTGLGKDKAIAMTVNPMEYVQKYLNYAAADSYVDTPAETTPENTTPADNTNTDTTSNNDSYVADNTDTVTPPPATDPTPVLNFKIEVKPNYAVGGNSEFSVLMEDQFGKVFKDGFTGEIVVSSDEGNVTAKKAILTTMDFDNNGVAKNSFSRLTAGSDRLKVAHNEQIFYSDRFVVTADTRAFSDLPADGKYYEAVMYLASKNIIAGYPDGTFQPEKTVSRVEALKLIFEGIKEKLSEGRTPFKDVSEKEWYSKYLYTAYKKRIVDGYPDGTFKPAGTVNKAEFYKMLFNGMGEWVPTGITEDPFTDVKKTDWFAPYLAHAKTLGIIGTSVKSVNPSGGMSRGEVAEAIYRLMTLVK